MSKKKYTDIGWAKKQAHERVKKVLLDPLSREALKSFGIDVELADENKKDDKPVVVILCPTYRAPEPQMQDALAAMVKYTREKGIATVYGGPPLGSSVIHWSRNGLLTEHIKSGKPWTHALLIDDDMVVEPDYLEKLLSHKKDIIAGLATRRQDPPIPNIRYFDEPTGKYEQIWEWPDKQLLEVGAVGTGLMLVSQHAFEQVAQAYFDCLWEKEYYGVSDEWVEKHRAERLAYFDDSKLCYWFRFLPGLKAPVEMGEDVGFCFMAKRYCDIPSYVDTTVQPGHIGQYAFSIKDFLPYREQMILESKVKGNYPMEIPPMKISILCPTRGRPENVKRLLDSLRDTSSVMPEVVFYTDDDDFVLPELYNIAGARTITGPRICLSEMWNRCAEVATGEILMHAGDDIIFRTKGWDDQVRRAFAAFQDRLIFVHGDDGVYGDKFGTHGFLHRAWIDAVGYFCPPYFSSDFNDTWFNEVFNGLRRRVALNFLTEHMHPIVGKAEYDQTHKDRLARHERDNVKKLYEDLAPERMKQIEKLRDMLGTAYVPKVANPDSDSTLKGKVPEAVA